MRRRTVVIAAIAATTALLAVGGVAWATGGDGEAPLSGDARTKAVDVALARVGGGTVLETEAGDDGAAYGVEIRLADGRVVEIVLDERFTVVGEEPDEDSKEESEDGD